MNAIFSMLLATSIGYYKSMTTAITKRPANPGVGKLVPSSAGRFVATALPYIGVGLPEEGRFPSSCMFKHFV